jgi:hypothetical protein
VRFISHAWFDLFIIPSHIKCHKFTLLGGIGCERAGSYLQALTESNAGAWKDKEAPKGIYQLRCDTLKYALKPMKSPARIIRVIQPPILNVEKVHKNQHVCFEGRTLFSIHAGRIQL